MREMPQEVRTGTEPKKKPRPVRAAAAAAAAAATAAATAAYALFNYFLSLPHVHTGGHIVRPLV